MATAIQQRINHADSASETLFRGIVERCCAQWGSEVRQLLARVRSTCRRLQGLCSRAYRACAGRASIKLGSIGSLSNSAHR